MKIVGDTIYKNIKYLVIKVLFYYITAVVVLVSMFTSAASAQQYNYTQYTSRDGLAGSTVYGITQDNDGYLWFATNAGVSRFDGIHFSNFTVQDGLAANETLGIVQGTNNRLWFISFSNKICFYSNGKIYNSANSEVVRKIQINSMVHRIYNSTDSATIIETNTESVIIKDKEVSCIPWSKNSTQTFCKYSLHKYGWVGNYKPEEFEKHSHIPAKIRNWFRDKVHAKNISLFYKKSEDGSEYVMAISGNEVYLFGDKIPLKKLSTNHSYISFSGPYSLFLRNKNSFYDYDILADKILVRISLPCIVNEIFKDNENEYWCSTNGQGVFKLPSLLCEHYTCITGGVSAAVLNISGSSGAIYLATNDGKYWQYNNGRHFLSKLSGRAEKYILTSSSLITPYQQIFQKEQAIEKPVNSFTIKTLNRFGDTVLAAASSGVYLLKYPGMHILKQFFKSRATCAIKGTDGNYYVGTLNGLYKVQSNDTAVSLGALDEILGQRISFLAVAPDGVLWVGTYGNGIIAIKNNRVLPHSKLLGGNVCSYLYCNKKVLWVATDKGVYKVNDEPGRYEVLDNYNIYDGIASDNINCVYADDDNVYAGTPVGLSVFKERATRDTLNILHLNKVIVSGVEIDKDAAITVLPHDENNIRFEFAALSYKSGNSIIYHYRLPGLDNEWHNIKEASLSYPALPSGSYRLELKATNRFGNNSNLVQFNFTVEKKFWEKVWVRAGTVVIAILITGLLIIIRIRVIKRKMATKLDTEKRIHTLEQMALRAQMNPHFIFNSLNSIQHFIVRQDVKGANKYLTQFGALIRQTLENSSKRYITLAEEISYLTHYIQLEQLQMAGSFEYEIITGAGLSTASTMIPGMVIQPFVENAIKHGVANCTYPVPKLHITFTVVDGVLIGMVEDNGPGIIAGVNNGAEHTHTSMGIAITSKRIELLNSIEKIEGRPLSVVEIQDLSMISNNKQTGTRVLLKIPV